MKSSNILIVEDDDGASRFLLQPLAETSYITSSKTLHKGNIPLAIRKGIPPDAILYYCSRTGSDLCHYFCCKENPGERPPFIVVYENIPAELAVGFMRAGAVDCIHKNDIKHILSALDYLTTTNENSDHQNTNYMNHTTAETNGGICQYEAYDDEINNPGILCELLGNGEEFIERVMKLSQGGIWVTDLNGIIIEVNDAYCRMSGFTKPELIGVHIGELDMTGNEKLFAEHIDRIIASGNGKFETVHKTREGTVRNVLVNVIYFCDHLYMYINDITDSIKTRRELEKSEEKFRSLFSSLHDAFSLNEIILDRNGNAVDFRVLDCNPAYEKLLCADIKDIRGRTASELFLQIDKNLMEICGEIAITGHAKNVESFSRGLGAYFRIHIFSPERLKFALILEDVTRLKENEEELDKYRNSLEKLVEERTAELDKTSRRLKEEIEKEKNYKIMLQQALEKEKELNEMKNRFISTVSHEFRTPLATMLSSAELVECYGRKWSEKKYREQISKIKFSVEHLTNLVDDLLIISRSDSGRITCQPQPTDIQVFIYNIMEEITPVICNYHHFVCSCKTTEQCYSIDQRLVRFILINLLSNSFKYSPDGGDVELIVEYQNGFLKFCISDQGIGIPDSDIAYLFEPFHRGCNTGDIPGTGLGMSIVKRSADICCGQVEVKKNTPCGTIVTVQIPVRY